VPPSSPQQDVGDDKAQWRWCLLRVSNAVATGSGGLLLELVERGAKAHDDSPRGAYLRCGVVAGGRASFATYSYRPQPTATGARDKSCQQRKLFDQKRRDAHVPSIRSFTLFLLRLLVALPTSDQTVKSARQQASVLSSISIACFF
jgi:hypothetical protein